jgi:hypothetical protein
VERELERDCRGGADEAELDRLRALCGTSAGAALWKDAGISTLNGELCACIADGRVAIDDPALLDHLMLSAGDRIGRVFAHDDMRGVCTRWIDERHLIG